MSIGIYKNNPTAAGVDGELVVGDGSNPIESGYIKAPDSGHEEGDWIRFAVRCASGLETKDDNSDGTYAVLSLEGLTDTDKWQLAPDNGSGAADEVSASAWGADLNIDAVVGDTNTLFHLRSRVAHNETPINDASVGIDVLATVGAE